MTGELVDPVTAIHEHSSFAVIPSREDGEGSHVWSRAFLIEEGPTAQESFLALFGMTAGQSRAQGRGTAIH